MDNKTIGFLKDTLIHKKYVIISGSILSKYLIENGNADLAYKLILRCLIHDNSKFKYEEINSFRTIFKINNGMVDPNILMDEFMKKAIAIHWKNNRHHPEHFTNPKDMSILDIMEMACDCYSRSLQYQTDLLSFIEIRQKERFNLPEEVYEKYKFYCTILINNNNNNNIKKLLKDK